MSSSKLTVALLRTEEGLRQYRETFDHRKEQESRWFVLRLRMAYLAIFMLPAVAVVAVYILLNHNMFGPTITNFAGAALFVDVLGLVASVWKIVLNPASVTKLQPMIEDGFPDLSLVGSEPDRLAVEEADP